jgi:hypothetical protein
VARSDELVFPDKKNRFVNYLTNKEPEFGLACGEMRFDVTLSLSLSLSLSLQPQGLQQYVIVV